MVKYMQVVVWATSTTTEATTTNDVAPVFDIIPTSDIPISVEVRTTLPTNLILDRWVDDSQLSLTSLDLP